MRLREIIRSGVTASAIAHASALVLVLLFTKVHPFTGVTAAEPITVDLVSPAEAGSSPPREQPVQSKSITPPTNKLASDSEVPGSPPSASPPPQEKAVLPKSSLDGQPTAVAPQPAPNLAPVAFTPPEPDLSIKYHVMLGLPSIASVAKSGS